MARRPHWGSSSAGAGVIEKLWADGNVFGLVWKHGRIGFKLPDEAHVLCSKLEKKKKR